MNDTSSTPSGARSAPTGYGPACCPCVQEDRAREHPLVVRRQYAEWHDTTLRFVGWVHGLLTMVFGALAGARLGGEEWLGALGTAGGLAGAAVGFAWYQVLAALGFVCRQVVERGAGEAAEGVGSG